MEDDWNNQTSFLSQHPSSPSWPSPPSLLLSSSSAMPLGCGGRVQGARQDLVQVDLHCWYNKTNQASLYNGCDISRGSKTNSVHLTPCTIQYPTNIPHQTHPQAAYCGCAGEGHWQVKAGLQGGSRPGLLQLIQNCFFLISSKVHFQLKQFLYKLPPLMDFRRGLIFIQS